MRERERVRERETEREGGREGEREMERERERERELRNKGEGQASNIKDHDTVSSINTSQWTNHEQ